MIDKVGSGCVAAGVQPQAYVDTLSYLETIYKIAGTINEVIAELYQYFGDTGVLDVAHGGTGVNTVEELKDLVGVSEIPLATYNKIGGVKTGEVYGDASIRFPTGLDENGRLFTMVGLANDYSAGIVKTVEKTEGMNSEIGMDENGFLWGADTQYILPVASAESLGGVKAVAKGSEMTARVGIGEDGYLYVSPITGETYTLPVASTELGGVRAEGKSADMTARVGIGDDGYLYVAPSTGETYELPVANNERLGGVKPVTKTDLMNLAVGVDSEGRLYASGYSLPVASASELGGVMPVTKTSGMTQTVGVDSSGKLYTTPAPVTSVNGQTGAVTVNVPVTSVNGNTGAVTLNASSVSAVPINGSTRMTGRIRLSSNSYGSSLPSSGNAGEIFILV